MRKKIKKNSRTVILRSWTAYCKRKLSKSSGKRTEQLLTTLFFWVVSHRRQEGKQTFQRVPSPPESVFAFLADFLLASTLSTGLAKQCCHKNHILFCIAALIGPDGSHAAGSSFFKKEGLLSGDRSDKTLKTWTASSIFEQQVQIFRFAISKYTTNTFYNAQSLRTSFSRCSWT